MGKKVTLAFVLAMFGAMVFPLPSRGQKPVLTGRGAAFGARPHVPFRGGHQGGYLIGTRNGRRSYRPGYYGYPYFYPPYLFGDYNSESAPGEAEPARVVVVENSRPRAEAPPPPPPESLMLELRGDHWVRVTDSGQTMANSQTGEKGSANAESMRTIAPQESAAVEPPRELPPAVLVFRDGHKEEVSQYTIVNGNIYTSADYWNSGSWTKKVPIAELDVPATLELNRERGANFSLPSSPHVVVIRP